jgi:serine/threonine protein kinase
MEHLPHPTLHEYVEIYKNSMSFLTKIHMASSIVQGLQILKNYGIVHMDLKPSNVVIAKRLITKLIDFG